MDVSQQCGCRYRVEFTLLPKNLCMTHLAMVLPNNSGLVSKTDRFKFFMNHVGFHTAYNSFSDAVEQQIMDQVWYFKQGDVVMDVGAAFGTYTLPALADGLKVIAFEPNAYLMQALNENIALNGWTDRCVVKAYGLGARTEDLPYNEADLSTAGDCGSMIKIRPLDEIIDEFHLDKLDMIKVDIEGMEIGFLEGAKQTLARFKPRLLIEVHNTADQLTAALNSLPFPIKIEQFNTGRLYFYVTPLLDTSAH